MKTAYNNPHQRGSPRLQGYDYGSDGVYFITICTKARQHFFGHISNGKMSLNDLGKVVEEEWEKTPEIRKSLAIALDTWCVMPNHFHALLIIGNPLLPLKNQRMPRMDAPIAQMGPQRQTLGAIIRGFKGACTKRIRQMDFPDFSWQPRYHDHIVRDQISWQNIRSYIINNPAKWNEDEFY